MAHKNLSRWLSANPSAALVEWQRVLQESSLPQLFQLLRATTERAKRLRQSSPFAGLLTREERAAILRRHDPHRV